MFRAASDGDTDTVRTLLAKDKYDLNWRGEYGMSPLHIATLNNHHDTAKLLIESGAKLNQFDDDGWTPLMAAAAFAEVRLVQMLLAAGANPTRRVQNGHHKGLNAKDLVKSLEQQKPTAVRKCLALLEGSRGPLAKPQPGSTAAVTCAKPIHTCAVAKNADGVTAWWARKETAADPRRGAAATSTMTGVQAPGQGEEGKVEL